MPVRGFQSSVDPRPHFGLGSEEKIDSLTVIWPDGQEEVVQNISINTTIEINSPERTPGLEFVKKRSTISQTWFTDITQSSKVDFTHRENEFVDFDRDRLIYHMLSAEGPALCTGDFNGDGREDIYLGGASEQSGAMYLQRSNNRFSQVNISLFDEDRSSEDVDCACFDADGDGDLDLYVASGGNEFPNSSSSLIDRLYINNGKGIFSKSDQILPSFRFENTSCVRPADFDGDGDLDLFVGVRARPFLYGVSADSYILSNDGAGKYSNVSSAVSTELKEFGMVTDAQWVDFDGDQDLDLLVVGEWMGITLLENQNGKLVNSSESLGLDSTNGWWNKIHIVDIDSDGDSDFILGNHGQNSRFKASRSKPVELYVNDFDQNGSPEAIICIYLGDKSYPLALKHDLIAQLPSLKKKYVQYESYKDQTVLDIFTPEQLENAVHGEAYMMETVILINNREDFQIRKLPIEAQLAPVYAINTDDFNQDGYLDIMLGGNFYYAKPEVGRYDASYGVILKGGPDGNYIAADPNESGFVLEDEIREIRSISGNNNKLLIAARNDQSAKIYSY